jgi:diadenosine tetraphosphate (Ap4A) HIT family hydrolase
MAAMRGILLASLALAAFSSSAEAQMACACDPANPETLKVRNCSLVNEALKQPPEVATFVLKDINPRKPQRWLVLPREYRGGIHPMHDLPRSERLDLWKFAVKTAQEKFGEDWALAYNGPKVRTQCHLHIHVGRWIKAADTTKFKYIARIEDLPNPEDSGILLRPWKSGFKVLTGEQIMETALVR